MRYVIVGLGAIGGTLAGRLHAGGLDVVGVARPGPHLDAIRTNGLLVQSPDGEARNRLHVHASIADVTFEPDDVVVLAVKSQNTTGVLVQLAEVAPPSIVLLCAQNGVSNEPEALRLFENVHGGLVQCPALHLEPGTVVAYSAPTVGILDVGRFPFGTSRAAQQITTDLRASGYSSRAVEDISRWKYAKLLTNLGNAVEAVCGPDDRNGRLTELLRTEGRSVLEHHGIAFASVAEDVQRRRGVLRRLPVVGHARPGGSLWQSVTRGQPTEIDYLCGEVVRLARLAGCAAPANLLVQRLTHDVASGVRGAGTVSELRILRSLAT